ncbi:MAG: hypothetical protein KDC54_09820 [Lewinella sp.]|nr:hypothetical protein [Lewinella sp.]
MADALPEPESSTGYWLQKLEAESYQVELVISGLAIYGSLQLLELVKAMIHWVNVEVGDSLLTIAYFTFTYFLIGVEFLIFTFILHFAMRALWVGMVGLASVYPQGIDFERKDRHSEFFLEQLKAEFPSLRGFNEQLDRLCSLVFAFSFGVVMVMLSIGLLLGAFLLIDTVVGTFVPSLSGWVAKGLIILLIGAFFVNMVMNLKFWWDAPLVRRVHYPYNRFLTHIIYLFMRQPLLYLTYTFMTNEKMSRLGIVYLISLVIALFSFISQIEQVGILQFNRDYHIKTGYRSDIYEYYEYADRLPADEYIYAPMLPSAEVRGDFVPLFVPTFARTRAARREACGEWATPTGESLSRREETIRQRQFTLDCYGRQLRVMIDSVPVSGLQWRFMEHPHHQEERIVAYLPIEQLAYGEHLL